MTKLNNFYTNNNNNKDQRCESIWNAKMWDRLLPGTGTK